MIDVIITYDLPSEKYDEFKKETLIYFEGKEREIDKRSPSTTIIVQTEKIGNVKKGKKDFITYLKTKNLNPTHLCLGILLDKDYL